MGWLVVIGSEGSSFIWCLMFAVFKDLRLGQVGVRIYGNRYFDDFG